VRLKLRKIIKLDADNGRRCLFVVKYLKWTVNHKYPLGLRCRVIRNSENFQDSQRVLDVLFERPANIESTNGGAGDSEYNNAVSSAEGDREDLTDLYTLSIDPPDCRIVDDALSILDSSMGMFSTVWVHIADVSHYVEKDTEVDQKAMQRIISFDSGSSDHQSHLLPTELARNICSLVAGKRRRCLSVKFEVDSEGNVTNAGTVSQTWIINSKRFTFREAQGIIDGNEYNENQRSCAITEEGRTSIQRLHKLAQKLRERRLGSGRHYYSFNNKLSKMAYFGNPFEVDQYHEARHLVEEFMILANTDCWRTFG
jgi:exoribonuclease R